MNSKTEEIAKSRFIQEFTEKILSVIKTKKITYINRQIIDTSLIPKVHPIINEKFSQPETEEFETLQKSIKNIQEEKNQHQQEPLNKKPAIPEKENKELKKENTEKKHEKIPIISENNEYKEKKKDDLKKLAEPIRFNRADKNQKPAPMQKPSSISAQTNHEFVQPNSNEDYGKLTPLINNMYISTIECPGPGKNIYVINSGEKQMTQITLAPEEIKNFLEKIAEKARVPLLEGVFRAAVENFVINAVVTESIGSRFIIKKQTPYSMLENQGPN